mmetsp:Transcript_98025/g.272797  ORF Transcript_98025/g.272797 Transcript_98025/m.272797 type:complete len:304 (-) Transcript_98025:1480-2391(-)
MAAVSGWVSSRRRSSPGSLRPKSSGLVEPVGSACASCSLTAYTSEPGLSTREEVRPRARSMCTTSSKSRAASAGSGAAQSSRAWKPAMLRSSGRRSWSEDPGCFRATSPGSMPASSRASCSLTSHTAAPRGTRTRETRPRFRSTWMRSSTSSASACCSACAASSWRATSAEPPADRPSNRSCRRSPSSWSSGRALKPASAWQGPMRSTSFTWLSFVSPSSAITARRTSMTVALLLTVTDTAPPSSACSTETWMSCGLCSLAALAASALAPGAGLNSSCIRAAQDMTPSWTWCILSGNVGSSLR